MRDPVPQNPTPVPIASDAKDSVAEQACRHLRMQANRQLAAQDIAAASETLQQLQRLTRLYQTI